MCELRAFERRPRRQIDRESRHAIGSGEGRELSRGRPAECDRAGARQRDGKGRVCAGGVPSVCIHQAMQRCMRKGWAPSVASPAARTPGPSISADGSATPQEMLSHIAAAPPLSPVAADSVQVSVKSPLPIRRPAPRLGLAHAHASDGVPVLAIRSFAFGPAVLHSLKQSNAAKFDTAMYSIAIDAGRIENSMRAGGSGSGLRRPTALQKGRPVPVEHSPGMDKHSLVSTGRCKPALSRKRVRSEQKGWLSAGVGNRLLIARTESYIRIAGLAFYGAVASIQRRRSSYKSGMGRVDRFSPITGRRAKLTRTTRARPPKRDPA